MWNLTHTSPYVWKGTCLNRAGGCSYLLYCICNLSLLYFPVFPHRRTCMQLTCKLCAGTWHWTRTEGEIVTALLSRRQNYVLSDASMYLTQVTEVCGATNEMDHIPTLMSYSWIGFSSMWRQLSWLNVCLQLHKYYIIHSVQGHTKVKVCLFHILVRIQSQTSPCGMW